MNHYQDKILDILANAKKYHDKFYKVEKFRGPIGPPIDREYALRYLKGNTNIRNGIDFEWNLMREIIDWMANQSQYPWDTSIFKIINNFLCIFIHIF